MTKLGMTFEQYNQDQIFYTRMHQNKLARNRNIDKTLKKIWNHKPNRGGFAILKPEDVLKILAENGIEIDIRTLQRYAEKDLITKPNTISAGRNHGRIADYAADTASQVLALHYTQGLFGKLLQKDVAKIRKIALIKNKYITVGYVVTGSDLIKLCLDKGLPIPYISEDVKFNLVDYALEKEISALKNIPEDLKKVIDLLVLNWLLAYHIYSGLSPLKDTKNYMEYREQLNFITSIYSNETIDKAIKALRELDI